MTTLLTTQQASAYLQLAPITLAVYRCHGKGPKYCRIGRRVLYRLADLDAFIEARIHTPANSSPATNGGEVDIYRAEVRS